MLKKFYSKVKMAIITKKQNQTEDKAFDTSEVILSDQELEFILIKLRDSNYKGHEFEQYAKIYKKIVDSLKK